MMTVEPRGKIKLLIQLIDEVEGQLLPHLILKAIQMNN